MYNLLPSLIPGVDAVANDLNTGAQTDPWDPEKDIRNFPTNGFGKIEFINEGLGGRKPAKVRMLKSYLSVEFPICGLNVPNLWSKLTSIIVPVFTTDINYSRCTTPKIRTMIS